MNKEFRFSACRRIINLWASVFELQIYDFGFPQETFVEFTICTVERMPVFAISQLPSFLGSGITVKTSISPRGMAMTVTIENFQVGRISDLWKMHERYFGR